MTDHEFGDCSLTVCDLCFMYVKGHSAGKEQAFLEIEELPAQGHPTTCACDPCCTVRMALRKLLGSDQQGGASVNRRLDVALVVAVAPISPASAADGGEILIEVGHSADVYGVTNNYGEVLSGGIPWCLLPTQTRKPRVPRGDPQRRGRRRAARRPKKPTKPQMPKVVVKTGG